MIWYRKDNYAPYLVKKVAKGLGCGEGIAYRPWHTNIASMGTSPKLEGIRHKRKHYFLSTLEYIYFMLIERDPSVIDIREQFPILDIDATLNLCAELGHAHKTAQGRPDPYSFDFLLTKRAVDGALTFEAKSIKPAGEAEEPATHQKLCIEYLWSDEHAIPWALVNTTQFTEEVREGLVFIRSWYQSDRTFTPTQIDRFSDTFLGMYSHSELLGDLIRRTGSKLRQKEDASILLFKHAAWRRNIDVSLLSRIAMNAPLALK